MPTSSWWIVTRNHQSTRSQQSNTKNVWKLTSNAKIMFCKQTTIVRWKGSLYQVRSLVSKSAIEVPAVGSTLAQTKESAQTMHNSKTKRRQSTKQTNKNRNNYILWKHVGVFENDNPFQRYSRHRNAYRCKKSAAFLRWLPKEMIIFHSNILNPPNFFQRTNLKSQHTNIYPGNSQQLLVVSRIFLYRLGWSGTTRLVEVGHLILWNRYFCKFRLFSKIKTY
jgi:hypothetical protein